MSRIYALMRAFALALLMACVVFLPHELKADPAPTDLQLLSDTFLTGSSTPTTTIIAVAYQYPYVLVDWGLTNAGGEYVAQCSYGSGCTVLFSTGGPYTYSNLTAQGVPSTTATFLINDGYPPCSSAAPPCAQTTGYGTSNSDFNYYY